MTGTATAAGRPESVVGLGRHLGVSEARLVLLTVSPTRCPVQQVTLTRNATQTQCYLDILTNIRSGRTVQYV